MKAGGRKLMTMVAASAAALAVAACVPPTGGIAAGVAADACRRRVVRPPRPARGRRPRRRPPRRRPTTTVPVPTVPSQPKLYSPTPLNGWGIVKATPGAFTEYVDVVEIVGQHGVRRRRLRHRGAGTADRPAGQLHGRQHHQRRPAPVRGRHQRAGHGDGLGRHLALHRRQLHDGQGRRQARPGQDQPGVRRGRPQLRGHVGPGRRHGHRRLAPLHRGRVQHRERPDPHAGGRRQHDDRCCSIPRSTR